MNTLRFCSTEELAEGETTYWDGVYYAHCPGPHGLIANLKAHNVVRHDDGTISVAPSIECREGTGGPVYHGFLNHGRWTPA